MLKSNGDKASPFLKSFLIEETCQINFLLPRLLYRLHLKAFFRPCINLNVFHRDAKLNENILQDLPPN
jgi:hypothetical protein